MSRAKLAGRKILVTGPAGQIAFPMARELARCNEVRGIDRLGRRSGPAQDDHGAVSLILARRHSPRARRALPRPRAPRGGNLREAPHVR
jgi:nucleoside-diphosphate-sugar epimerase